MKAFSVNSAALIDRPSVEPIRLLKIELTDLTLRLCDRAFRDDALRFCYFDGEHFEPLIAEFGSIRAGQVDPVTYESEPSSAHFVIINDVPVGGADRFSELFGLYAMQTAKVTISEIYSPNAVAADIVDLFVGTIEDITGLTRGRATVTCAGFELDIVNRFIHTICADSGLGGYPSADPDEVGKMVPQIYGDAKRVPALAIDAGGKTTIAEDITATTPGNGGTLEISDGTAFPTGACIVQIDSEQISIASRSGNVLTLAASGARGYAATDAVAHDMGAPIAEIQTEYIYLLADHPVDEIADVYVDGIRQTTVNKYTGKTGDEKTGYEGKAIISFDVLPSYTKQINVEVNDTIDVDDTIGVDQGSHNHGGTEQVIVWRFEQSENIQSNVYNPGSCVDGDMSTYTTLDNLGAEVRLSKAYYEQYDGTPSQVRLCIATGSIGSGARVEFRFAGKTYDFSSSNTVSKSSWSALSTSYDSWAELNAAQAYLEVEGNNNSCLVAEAWAEIKYTPAANSSPADGVAKTGSASKVGTVTIDGNSTAETVIGSLISADATGYIDDASGTYTGTANAVIERPDHVFKHILLDRCGLSSDAIDAASYADAGSFYAGRYHRIGFAIIEKPNVRELLNRLAYQVRTVEFWDAGKHFLSILSTEIERDKEIDSCRIDQGQIWLSYTDRVDILNKFTATYLRHWSGKKSEVEANQAIYSTYYLSSIELWGERQAKPFDFFALNSSIYVVSTLNSIRTELMNPRLMVEFAGGHYLTDLTVGDIVTFPISTDPALNDAGLGLITSDGISFKIIEKTYRSDSTIQIKGIYCGVAPVTSTPEDITVAIEIDGDLFIASPDLAVAVAIDGDLVLTQKHVGAVDDLTVNVAIDSPSFTGVDYFILLESGDFLLLETGDKVVKAKAEAIKTESGDYLMTESGDNLVTEI